MERVEHVQRARRLQARYDDGRQLRSVLAAGLRIDLSMERLHAQGRECLRISGWRERKMLRAAIVAIL
jgi:hypothetical protein